MNFNNETLTLNTFTDTTKHVCSCLAISILLIVLFTLTPLSKLLILSMFMRVIIIIILIYTIYLNFKQTQYLKNVNQINLTNDINRQLNINIICSYVFTLFIALLIIFVAKTFF